nr:MAG TPA: hypothetical protein [Caudoviricetes sp.]
MGKLFSQKNSSNALPSHSVYSMEFLHNRNRRRQWL